MTAGEIEVKTLKERLLFIKMSHAEEFKCLLDNCQLWVDYGGRCLQTLATQQDYSGPKLRIGSEKGMGNIKVLIPAY